MNELAKLGLTLAVALICLGTTGCMAACDEAQDRCEDDCGRSHSSCKASVDLCEALFSGPAEADCCDEICP